MITKQKNIVNGSAAVFCKITLFFARSQNGAMPAALDLPRRGADGQTNTRLRIFSFAVSHKKDRPEEGRSFFASNTIASRPTGVAEGHSMSILLLGFLG